MIDNPQASRIKEKLFANSYNHLYAIIDGIAYPQLRFKICGWELKAFRKL